MELTQGIRDLYQRLLAIEATQTVDEDVEKLEVDDMASRLALFYEKVRNTVDYKEDQLLRRFAMERFIKRKLMMDSLRPKVARSMIEDLIRARYLPNGTLPETIIPSVERVVAKYEYLFQLLEGKAQKAKNKKNYYDWLVGIMACELDMILASENRSDALIEALYNYVKDRVKIKGQGLSIREKNIQLYITIHKDLLLSDNAIISYHLMNLYFPDWIKNDDKQLIEYVAEKLPSIYLGIQGHLNFPHQGKIKNALKKELAVFKVLKQLVENNPGDQLTDILSKPELFEEEARKILKSINGRIRNKITRRSIRAIVYIFLTKMLLAIALEYPYDLFIVHKVNYLALTINALFPPFLMFTVALTSAMPKKDSYEAIITSLKSYIYGEPESHTLFLLKSSSKRRPVLNSILYLFYFVIYVISFGFIIYALKSLHFNYLSIGLFIFFVTVVSFFALRIRQATKEYNVVKTRQGILAFLLNFFSLPIVKLGQALSSNMRHINLFIFIFDFILEAPFKLFIESFESLVGFLKEKREEIYKE